MILETIRIALNSLRTNKLRTFLSMLGIVIGVAAVIAIVSIGFSAQHEVTGQITNLGSDLIWVMPGFSGDNVDPREYFKTGIVDNINRLTPDIKNIVPEISERVSLIRGDNRINSTAVGTTPAFSEVNLYFPLQGRFLEQSDIDGVRNSIVLGYNIAEELFKNHDPSGQRITVNHQNRNLNFTVIGVMEEKGQGITGNFDNRVYLPVNTFSSRIVSRDFVDLYYAQASGSITSYDARRQLEYFFLRYLGDEDQFRIMSQDQILDVLNQVTAILGLMLGGIAGISLLVGGIGIMNIMLVSVTERTREIGIRKALGAKRRNILGQFLIESLCLSGIGGVIGIGLGILGTYMVTEIGGWSLIISPPAVILAFGFALSIGLFFGIYPAVKASRLDPVDALSYE